jgi:L-lactate dehydrogenase complex protein LldF
MTDPFREQIRQALLNPNLQAALDSNAARRHRARLESYTSLPQDVQLLRQQAHAVRVETIQHLDHYLTEFTRNAQANGMIVHQAANSAEAVAQVLALVKHAGAQKVVKSKTMVGDEIEINPALERAGVQVTETDLGEWIVQMRGERPAHILTPAVHLRRQDVGRLFHEKLGIPYTEDVAELTAVARLRLRQAFLEADVGISGVNFGVASEGALCLLTNEGNGRMATTLPRLHIALMGLERLVPTLDDLALMLSILPRSSSGQKLTVYTNLIRGPRQPGEVDGPLERHLILLDNGRRAMRNSPLKEALYCIRCGACLNECPVFRELGGHAYVGDTGKITPYTGPIGSVVSPGLFGFEEFGNLARATSLCGACQEACPVNIPLPDLLLRVRAGQGVERIGEGKFIPWHLRMALNIFSWLTPRPGLFRTAQKMAGLLGRVAAPRSGWLRMPAWTGWGLSRELVKPAGRSFHDRWKEIDRTEDRRPKTGSEGLAQNARSPSVFQTGQAADSTVEAGNIPNFSNSLAGQPSISLVDRFERELTALGGRLVRTRRQDLLQAVAGLLRELGIEEICAWQAGELPDGLLAGLEQAGVRVHFTPDPSLRLGLTGALAGAAESGTLYLPGSASRPPYVSLLPEIHLAVLEAGCIVKSLGELLKMPEIRQALRQASNSTLISGPSRTGDIELTLTIGVHGPCQVIVVCVLD